MLRKIIRKIYKIVFREREIIFKENCENNNLELI